MRRGHKRNERHRDKRDAIQSFYNKKYGCYGAIKSCGNSDEMRPKSPGGNRPAGFEPTTRNPESALLMLISHDESCVARYLMPSKGKVEAVCMQIVWLHQRIKRLLNTR